MPHHYRHLAGALLLLLPLLLPALRPPALLSALPLPVVLHLSQLPMLLSLGSLPGCAASAAGFPFSLSCPACGPESRLLQHVTCIMRSELTSD